MKKKKTPASETNISLLQRMYPKAEANAKNKQRSTFSGQYDAPSASTANKATGQPSPPNKSTIYADECNCDGPPQPYPPEDDLWDLQFCRWWGWNWVRKRDEIVNQQMRGRNTNRNEERKNVCHPRKRHKAKQDDFFSWCNKLFKGRQRNCPLKEQEKELLQEMYDTPSAVTMNKFYHTEKSKWDYKSSSLPDKCYCINAKQTSVSSVCVRNTTRRQIEKGNRRKHESWVCERAESSSSEEGSHHVCKCNQPATNAEDSVEYISLRLQSLNSDEHAGGPCCKCRTQPREKRCAKEDLPRKFKIVRDTQGGIECKCNKNSNPYNAKFSDWKCTCGRNCKCLQNGPRRYPQFSRFNGRNERPMEFILRCPVIRDTKSKTKPPSKCCSKCKCNNSKPTVDKSVSGPSVNKRPGTIIQRYEDNIIDNFRKIALNPFDDTMASALKSGRYSSPVSGKIYELNPHIVHTTTLTPKFNYPNPFNANTEFVNRDHKTEPLEDNEHRVILSAVCDAIMSSHLQGKEEKTFIEEETAVYDFDQLHSDYEQLFDSLNDKNFIEKVEAYLQKPVVSTDKFVGYYDKNDRYYQTVPLKKIKNTGMTGSRIPLLKKRKTADNTDGVNVTSKSSQTLDVGRNKYIYESSCSSDDSSRGIVSSRSPWSILRSPKLPGISMDGLFSAFSNTFINKNRAKKSTPPFVREEIDDYVCETKFWNNGVLVPTTDDKISNLTEFFNILDDNQLSVDEQPPITITVLDKKYKIEQKKVRSVQEENLIDLHSDFGTNACNCKCPKMTQESQEISRNNLTISVGVRNPCVPNSDTCVKDCNKLQTIVE